MFTLRSETANQALLEGSPALGEVEWTLPVDSSPDNKLHEEDQQ